MPTIAEYPCDGGKAFLMLSFVNSNDICLMNSVNFSTTKPNAIIPMLVRIHARNVLSFAM
jgi:hypothetical protein